MLRRLCHIGLLLTLAFAAPQGVATPELDACLFGFATVRARRPGVAASPDFTDPAPFIASLEKLKTLDPHNEAYHLELSHLLFDSMRKPDIASDQVFRILLRQLFDRAKRENPDFWTSSRKGAIETLFTHATPVRDAAASRAITAADYGNKVPGDTLVRLNLALPEWRESKLISRFFTEILGTKALKEAIAEAELGRPQAFRKLVNDTIARVAKAEKWSDHETALLENEAGADVLRDLADSFFRPKKPEGWRYLDYALKIDPHSHWAGALPTRDYLSLLREHAGNPENFYQTAVEGVFENYFNRPGQKLLEIGAPFLHLLRVRGLLKSWFTEPPYAGGPAELKLKLSGREGALTTVKAADTKNSDRADIARTQIARFRENIATASLTSGLTEFKADLATAMGKKFKEMGLDTAATYKDILDILDDNFVKNRGMGGNASTILPILLKAEDRAIGAEVILALKQVAFLPNEPYKSLAESLLAASNHLPFSLTYFTRNPMETAFFGTKGDAKTKQDAFRKAVSKATMEHLIREGIEVFEVSMNGTQLKPENLDELQRFGQGKVTLRPLFTIDGQEITGLTPPTEAGLRRALADPRVAGTDFAGPEQGTAAPRKEAVEKALGDLAKILGDTYTSRKEAAGNAKPPTETSPLLMRIHIGEGFRNPGEALDPKFARERLGTTLEALKELIPKLPDGVVIRLAHVTHASPEHTKLMGELAKSGKFFVDAPILSNIVTKALADKPYANHPLLGLMFNKVPTMLGSDGGGTMHFSLRENYRLAGLRMLNLFREGKLTMELPDGRSMTYEQLIENKILTREEAAERFSLRALEDSAQLYRKTLKLP